MALIYTHLEIFTENLMLYPPVARLSTETVVGVLVSGFIQTFTSASRRCQFHRHRPLSHSFMLFVTHLGLSFAHFCFSRYYFSFSVIYFTFPSLFWLLSCFLVPSLASFSFTSASRRRRWLLTRSFQLLVAKVDFSSSQESHRRAIKP